MAYSVQQISDGGYIVAGAARSYWHDFLVLGLQYLYYLKKSLSIQDEMGQVDSLHKYKKTQKNFDKQKGFVYAIY